MPMVPKPSPALGMPEPHAKFHQNRRSGFGGNCGQINTQCVILIRIHSHTFLAQNS